MASQKTRNGFPDTEEGIEVKQLLRQMTGNSTYNTSPSYSTDSARYPDNLIPFVDKHMNYLINHPALEPAKYLANIKLITRRR
jgi:hypothetical protein